MSVQYTGGLTLVLWRANISTVEVLHDAYLYNNIYHEYYRYGIIKFELCQINEIEILITVFLWFWRNC